MSNAKPREPKKPLAKDEIPLTKGGASEKNATFGTCLRWDCKANGIKFEFGAPTTHCRGCGELYSNRGDRAQRLL